MTCLTEKTLRTERKYTGKIISVDLLDIEPPNGHKAKREAFAGWQFANRRDGRGSSPLDRFKGRARGEEMSGGIDLPCNRGATKHKNRPEERPDTVELPWCFNSHNTIDKSNNTSWN